MGMMKNQPPSLSFSSTTTTKKKKKLRFFFVFLFLFCRRYSPTCKFYAKRLCLPRVPTKEEKEVFFFVFFFSLFILLKALPFFFFFFLSFKTCNQCWNAWKRHKSTWHKRRRDAVYSASNLVLPKVIQRYKIN